MFYKNNFLDYLKEGFLNLVYPLSCENCGEEIRESKGYSICDNCINQIELISFPYCYQCGKPLSSMVSFEKKALCANCYNKKNHFYFNRSVAHYQGVMRKCIHLLKYKKQVKLVKVLGELMVNYLRENDIFNPEEINLIIPVPLFKGDYHKRSFNQSALLAKHIADYYLIPYNDSLLIKKVGNLSQVGLSRTERENNVRQVYSINLSCEIDFANILLIDDIYTTGATAEACSRELRKKGLGKLYVLTLAG